jgi:hypothetical protein
MNVNNEKSAAFEIYWCALSCNFSQFLTFTYPKHQPQKGAQILKAHFIVFSTSISIRCRHVTPLGVRSYDSVMMTAIFDFVATKAMKIPFANCYHSLPSIGEEKNCR